MEVSSNRKGRALPGSPWSSSVMPQVLGAVILIKGPDHHSGRVSADRGGMDTCPAGSTSGATGRAASRPGPHAGDAEPPRSIVPLPPRGDTGIRTGPIDPGPIEIIPEPLPPRQPDPAPPVRIEAQLDPRFASALQPQYPASEQRAQNSGTVRIRVTIGTDGRVRAVERVSATSDAFCAAAERQALSRWRFRPATVDGRPVESIKVMTVHFRIARGLSRGWRGGARRIIFGIDATSPPRLARRLVARHGRLLAAAAAPSMVGRGAGGPDPGRRSSSSSSSTRAPASRPPHRHEHRQLAGDAQRCRDQGRAEGESGSDRRARPGAARAVPPHR